MVLFLPDVKLECNMESNWREVLSWKDYPIKDLKRRIQYIRNLYHGDIFWDYYNDTPIDNIQQYALELLQFEEEFKSSLYNNMLNFYQKENYIQVVLLYSLENINHGEVAGSFIRYLVDHGRFDEVELIVNKILKEGIGFDS